MARLELVVLPNVETALVQLLQNESNMQQFAPFTVSSTMIAYNNQDTWLHINRTGGRPTWPIPDRPMISFQSYSPDKTKAELLAQTARAVVHSYSVEQISDKVVLAGATDYMGLSFVPDAAGIMRYAFGIQLVVRPATQPWSGQS